LHIENGHCTAKQLYGNVLKNVVKVANGLWVLLAIPYVAIRIMEDIGLCDGRNINIYPRLQ
jgi:hypothetical protein